MTTVKSIARTIAESYSYNPAKCEAEAETLSGVNINQDWDREATEYTFTDDGSVLTISGPCVEVEDSSLAPGQ